MNDTVVITWVVNFLLLFSRILGITILNPIFSRREIPYVVKIGLSLFLTLILKNLIPEISITDNIVEFSVILIKEFLIGLIIGFVSFLFFHAIYIAGELIDMSMGFGIVNVLDIQNNVQVPIMGNFLYILSLLIFIMINGHYYFISAIFDSYKFIPMGVLVVNDNFLQFFINAFIKVFSIGFKLSAPVVITILLVDIALGILSRTVPQMNVFMVGMPLRVLVGIITMMIALPVFIFSLNALFDGSFEGIYNIIKIIGGAS
ncbi:flagellar biosynthetic protein FliR [Calorimonas adulescens]|jgi:flagellar biosynthetic protein FliR|uniref:Flagellar biosynthetic protein FliR n=1 Tax=Calorimonas adulescens TaxID=2606906 RepID=A0A5D8QGJ0_9THEO|nr:flagellar biosynthetic protein FliR [Calorimonas adulescens]TZE83339.1 flagellar type III secretion system protein FliR [Calorimonas adulescens]